MSLGNTLRQARAARQISLNQAALETRIRQSVLEALEADDFSALPPRPFLRGLLRNYALYLNLDADAVLEEFDFATGVKPSAAPPAPVTETPPPVSAPPEALVFPAFETPMFQQANEPAHEPPPLPPPPEPETTFIVAPEIEGDIPEPTPPLNLSQEPQTFAQKIGGSRIPEIVAILALAVALFGLISVGLEQFNQFQNLFGPPATPLPSPTAERTAPPGSTRTPIPTLAQTVEAFTPVSFTGAQQTATPITPTLRATAPLSPTIENAVNGLMTLTVETENELEAWIVADGEEVFNGALRNETRTWTARAQLFMQIKNITQGRVALNGRRILPRDQQERSNLVRAWLMNPQGTPVAVPPTPFPGAVESAVAPTMTPGATLTPTLTPSATLTLTNSPSITPRATRVFIPTHTVTRTVTMTPTQTISITLTATRAP